MSNFSFRWGVELFDNAHTQIPNRILQYYHLVPWQILDEYGNVVESGTGISNTEMMFIIHLASFKYESERGMASPSLTSTIRERMNYKSNQGIINIKEGLEQKGLLIVGYQPGKTSTYDFAPLSERIMEIAQSEESSTKVDQYPSTKVDQYPSTKVDSKKKREKENKEEKGVASATPTAENFDDMFPPKNESLMDQVRSGDPDKIAHAQMAALGLGAKQQMGDGVGQIRLVGWKIKSTKIEAVVGKFLEATKLSVPATKTERGQWLAGASDHLDEFGLVGLCELYQVAWKEYFPSILKGEIDITHPAALTKKMRAIQQRQQIRAPDSNGHGEIFTDPITGEVIRW